MKYPQMAPYDVEEADRNIVKSFRSIANCEHSYCYEFVDLCGTRPDRSLVCRIDEIMETRQVVIRSNIPHESV